MKRGRPREVEDAVRVTTRLPGSVFDRLDRQAHQAGHGSVARILREQAISASQNRHPEKPVHNQ